MKIMITGAGGLVGKEFTRQLSQGHEVLPLTRRELDITNAAEVSRLMLTERPALVINCAVCGTERSELEPSLARSVNARGPETLARMADEIDARFVQMSTNYVFDGTRSGTYYTHQDATAPLSIYAQTKLTGELAVRAAARQSFIVRTSWIFGSGKQNFFSTAPRVLQQGKKVQAITDIWASATYVSDLVSRVIEILAGGPYATYHVVNDGVCSYYDFALEVARILAIPESTSRALIEPVLACELAQKVKRPRWTPLQCLVSADLGLPPLRSWRASLAEYIQTSLPLSSCQPCDFVDRI